MRGGAFSIHLSLPYYLPIDPLKRELYDKLIKLGILKLKGWRAISTFEHSYKMKVKELSLFTISIIFLHEPLIFMKQRKYLNAGHRDPVV